MKILLTQAGEARGVAPVFPLGLAYLAGALSDTGYDIRGFDLPLAGGYDQELEQTVATFCPHIICVSLRNLDNQRYANPVSFLPEARKVVGICRLWPTAKVIVGGSGFSIDPESLLAYLKADAGVAGEAETAIGALVLSLTGQGDNLPGLVRGRQGKGTLLRPSPANDLDTIKLPDRGIFEPEKYLRKRIPLNIRAKRGCPFRCIYCTTPQIEGTQMRVRSPERVVDELEMLKGIYGADEFYFTDNIFNYPRDHAEAICEGIISRSLSIRWYCIANPCSLSKDLLHLMKRAGCYGLSLGNESGSPRMLKALRKNFTVEQVTQSCQACRDLGISYTCFLLLGGPGEDRQSVAESVALMEALGPDHLSIAIGIRIYPHTELARISVAERIINADSDLLTPTFYLSGQVRDWIFEYIKEAGERNGWVYPSLPDTPRQ